MVKPSIIDLRPNRVLLNPHFDSYKLSLETFRSIEIKFEKDAAECYKPESCFSFHHAKICSDFNALAVNSIGDGECSIGSLFTADGDLILVDLTNMLSQKAVWKVPNYQPKKGLAISSCFVRPNLLLVEDGIGSIFLLEVGHEPEFSAKMLWCGSLAVDGNTTPEAVLMDNAFISDSGEIDFFSLAAESCNDLPEWARTRMASSVKKSKVSEESGYATSVYWHKLLANGEGTWSVSCVGRFVSSANCSLAARVADGGIVLGGERPFVNVMLPEEKETEHKNKLGEGKLYSWHQDKEFVTVTFHSIHVNTKKEDVTVDIKPSCIAVKVKGGDDNKDLELDGVLGGDIKVDGSTWIIDDSPEFVGDPYADHRCVKKLEISLAKAEPTTWISCIAGDEQGHLVLTDDQLELVRDLAHPGAKHPRQSIYDDDEANDVNAKICRNDDDDDDDDENDATVQWCDHSGKTCSIIYVGSAQAFLFYRSHPTLEICLKNDVDGCVWRPKIEQTANGATAVSRSLEHVSTFDALAFVLSSKENRRFTSCTPDLKLAAVADWRHHIYVYCQPEPATLFNRKSGGHQTVSRQYVVAVDPPDESIIGFHVSNSAIFALTPKRLVRFALKQDS